MTTRAFAIALALATWAGCSGGSSTVDARPIIPDTPPDGPPGLTFSVGTARSRRAAAAAAAAAGSPTPPCASRVWPKPGCTPTAIDGTFATELTYPSAPTNVTQVTTADGYLGSVFLSGWTSNEAIYASVTLLTTADATTLLQSQAGFTFPTQTGFVEIFVGTGNDGSAAVGATASIPPASGAGPVYLDATGTPDPTLTSATSSGLVLWGNLEPGDDEVTVTDTGKACTAFTGGQTPPVTSGYFAPTGGATVGVAVAESALTASPDVVCQ